MNLAIKLEIFNDVLSGIAEEMGVRLQRSAYSPNIKERRDYSCALFDADGELAAQAAHIPVHLGSMPILMEKILEQFDPGPGDVIITNDPFSGGTHLPDVTLVESVFVEGRRWGFAAARAHHSDVGGMSPGSMPDSREVYQEGIIIPPLYLKRGGKLNRELLTLITRNTRTPRERTGDLFAQEAALSTARERVARMGMVYGFDESLSLCRELMDYSERLTRAGLVELGTSTVSAVDYIEGASGNIPIQVMINLQGDSVLVDFSGTAPGQEANFNAPLPVTMAAVYYTFRSLIGDHVPANQGCFRPIKVRAPEGCLLNAKMPVGVCAGNVETSQRVVDVLLLALSKVLPGRIPAASNGSMNNVAIGGHYGKGKESFAYYETIGGGTGGGPDLPGLSGVHSHMTNTFNTPVEALETTFPFMITKYGLRTGSGGDGKNPGGEGIIREYLFQAPCQVSLATERRRIQPWGLAEGKPGKKGINRHFDSKTGRMVELPGKTTLNVASGDRLTIETPGGGGWGKPLPDEQETV